MWCDWRPSEKRFCRTDPHRRSQEDRGRRQDKEGGLRGRDQPRWHLDFEPLTPRTEIIPFCCFKPRIVWSFVLAVPGHSHAALEVKVFISTTKPHLPEPPNKPLTQPGSGQGSSFTWSTHRLLCSLWFSSVCDTPHMLRGQNTFLKITFIFLKHGWFAVLS